MNKKGMTLVEIIISIALISIVLIFLFSLLVTVNDMNDEADINSTYLINKSLILKNVEKDLTDTTNVKIDKICSITDFYSNYSTYKDSLSTEYKASKCLKITYDNDTSNPAYLGIYYYQNKSTYVISYIHGNTKATRELPEFEKYNVDNTTGKLKKDFDIRHNSQNTFHKITIPIIGNDGKDYSILISYYGLMSVN